MTRIFLVIGIVATIACFARSRPTAGVLAGYVGLVGLAIGAALSYATSSSSGPLLLGVQAFALVATVLAVGPDVLARRDGSAPTWPPDSRLKRALVAGLIGATPGLVLVTVPLALAELGVGGMASTQFVFLGLPMIPTGLIVGLAYGATSSRGSTEPW